MNQLIVDKGGLLSTQESTLFWAYLWLGDAAQSECTSVRYSPTFSAVMYTMDQSHQTATPGVRYHAHIEVSL